MNICSESSDYVNSDDIIEELNKDCKKKNNIRVLEDCSNDNISLCSFSKFNNNKNTIIKHSLNLTNEKKIKDVKSILFKFKRILDKFIKNITILKSRIVTRSSKEMKSYFNDYKKIIFIFISELETLLSRRNSDYYIVNNVFHIYNSNNCSKSKASFKNINYIKKKDVKLLYSIPGFTIEHNTKNMYLKITVNKSKYNFNKGKSSIIKFNLLPKLSVNCNQISKTKFINIIDDIYNYCYSKSNNIKEFFKFLKDELSYLDELLSCCSVC